MSLVALDALKFLYRKTNGKYQTMLLDRLKPELLAAPARGEMETKLCDYGSKDAVPRVERDVDMIVSLMSQR